MPHHNRTPFLSKQEKRVHIVNFLEISGLIHGKIGIDPLFSRFVAVCLLGEKELQALFVNIGSTFFLRLSF